MSIVDYKRIVSGPDTQIDDTSRELAVLKAINKVAGAGPIQDAVVIGNAADGMWPILQRYPNDNSGGGTFANPPFRDVPAPQFIWFDTGFSPGEKRYFAHAIKLDSTLEHVMFTTTFCDNAHLMFVEEYTPTGGLDRTFTPAGGLFDKTMAATANEEDQCPPFSWQYIRAWSSNDIFPHSSNNYLVISFEVLNYNSNDTLNPAGLAYVADVYRLL